MTPSRALGKTPRNTRSLYMTNRIQPDLRCPLGKLLAVYLSTLYLGLSSSAADVSSEPIAWIHFSRGDKDISLFNGYPMYFVSGGGLEVHLDVDPDTIEPGSVLQFGTGGATRVVKVVERVEDELIVDGNHPLAGLTLRFDVAVLEAREATADELEAADEYAQANRG